jgi:hypothetical protein
MHWNRLLIMFCVAAGLLLAGSNYVLIRQNRDLNGHSQCNGCDSNNLCTHNVV